ncbi:MAG: hypothetical protein ACF788_12840 [Novipirellula sp. JB048]
MLVALTSAFWSASQAFGKGVRFGYDKNNQVISAEYWGRPGSLESLALSSYPNLVSLDITYYTTLNQSDLDQIAKITSLEELTFGQDAILGETVAVDGDPSVLRSLKRLEWMKVSVAEFDQSDWGFLNVLPRLEYLEVDVGLDFDAKSCTLTDDFGKTLGEIQSLRELSLWGAEDLTDAFISNVADRNKRCESLMFGDGEFTDAALARISRDFPELIWLEIGGNRISDRGVEHLSRLPKLEMLTIYSGSLSTVSVRSAAKIPTLTKLELGVVAVDVADIRLLSKLPKLERVIFRQLALSDESLSCFTGHPTLVSLFCDGSQLDLVKTIQVVQSLPNVDYLSVGPASSPIQQAVSREVKRIEQLRKAGDR